MALPDWPRAWGVSPPITATLRAAPADFFVEEQLGFTLTGSGEHCWLWIEKENLNTVDAAQRLAKFAGMQERDISFGGLKDKNAVTRQWFSLHLINHKVDWAQWNDPNLRLLEITRHDRKLRRGGHRANRFELILRNVAGDMAAFEMRLNTMVSEGVPNYFGEQRFGRDGRNIDNARQWIAAGMPKRQRMQISMMLSSLRSWLFNEVLAARIVEQSWSRASDGEVFMLDGTGSVFTQALDETLEARLVSGDIHLTGPLPGRASSVSPSGAVAELEHRVAAQFVEELAALERVGLTAERRALRVIPRDLHWQQVGATDWQLGFTLPRGCFATSLVRELATISPNGFRGEQAFGGANRNDISGDSA
ncbi:MAG: tRNA pseudouridine(13) synthase TruD [Spongiibacteraceae bacterium]